MTIKVAKRFFNQNYNNFSFLLPLFIIKYQTERKGTPQSNISVIALHLLFLPLINNSMGHIFLYKNFLTKN